MDEQKILAERFEAERNRLRSIAYRMLGSRAEAEDAVQETWLRLARADTSDVGNLSGWLTTVVARVCLDMLRTRKTRREEPQDADTPEPAAAHDAEQQRELADNIGIAMLVVLENLAPAERIAFVLHDMFDLPFDEIAPIVDRSPAAARQLASRARRRVQGASPEGQADRERQREIVDAFLAASRGGDMTALLAVLDPNVVLRADAQAVDFAKRAGGGFPLSPELRGAQAVADLFNGRAAAARVALLDDAFGAVFAPAGKPAAAFEITIVGGRIAAISVIADPARLAAMEIRPAG
jgi:RNA polymerase sigma factor (sigma-70 family)